MSFLFALAIAVSPPPDDPVIGTVTQTGVVVGVVPGGPTPVPPAAAPGASATPGYPQQSLVPACNSNASCATDFDCAGGTPYYIYTQASADVAPVNTLQEICVHNPKVDANLIPDSVVKAAGAVWDVIPLDGGSLALTPQDGLPVGLPLLVRVTGATHVDKTFVLDDIPLHLTATESYTWTFGDGTHLTTSSPGIPYDPMRPPDDPQFAGDYVEHTYDEPGELSVSEETTWSQVVLTRTDTGVQVPLPDRAVGRPQVLQLDVIELRSQLTTP